MEIQRLLMVEDATCCLYAVGVARGCLGDGVQGRGRRDGRAGGDDYSVTDE